MNIRWYPLLLALASSSITPSNLAFSVEDSATVQPPKAKGEGSAELGALPLDQRMLAIQKIGRAQDLTAYPDLIKVLAQSNDAQEQQTILRTLEKLPYTISMLQDALKNGEEAVGRSYAAYTLGRMRADTATPDLITALEDPDADVREKVITALGAIGDPSAFKGLIRAAHKDPSPALRKLAEKQATRIGAGGGDYVDEDTLIARLGSPDANERQRSASALGQHGSWWAVPPLVEALKDPHPDVRQRSIAALGELKDSRASIPLMNHLSNTAGMERYLTLASISLIGDEGARTVIQPYLNAEDSQTRRAAARALNTLADPDATPALGAALSKEPLPDLKQEYINALGHLAQKEAVPFLEKASQKREVDSVRFSAIRALGLVEDPSALPPLEALLKDKNALVRASTADALANRDDAADSLELIQTLERMSKQDSDPYAQQTALEASLSLRGKRRLKTISAP